MDIQYKIPDNLYTLSKDDITKYEKSVFKKLKQDLCNKYKKIIYDKEFNVNDFDKMLMKIVRDYNYFNNLQYNEILIKSEKTFLKELSKKEDQKRRKHLEKPDVKRIILQPNYYFYEGYKKEKNDKKIMIPNIYKNKNRKEIALEKEKRRLTQEKCEIDVEKRLQHKKEMNYVYIPILSYSGNQVKDLMKQE